MHFLTHSFKNHLTLWLSQEFFYLQICKMLFVCIFFFVLRGTLEIFGWVHVCAAGILEPLAYTGASSSEFFPPYTRLNLPVYLFSRIQL